MEDWMTPDHYYIRRGMQDNNYHFSPGRVVDYLNGNENIVDILYLQDEIFGIQVRIYRKLNESWREAEDRATEILPKYLSGAIQYQEKLRYLKFWQKVLFCWNLLRNQPYIVRNFS